MCRQFKKDRKAAKKSGISSTESNRKGEDGVQMYTDASGLGASMCMKVSDGESMLMLRSSCQLSVDLKRPDGRPLPGPNKELRFEFDSIDKLNWQLQLFLCCCYFPDLKRVKRIVNQYATGFPRFCWLRAPGVQVTCLDWAARKGLYDIAEYLATDSRTKNFMVEGACVGWACYTNKVDLAKMLVKHGADPHKTEPPLFNSLAPVFVAAENGSFLAMKWLVEEHGVDITALSSRGMGILGHVNSAKVDGFRELGAGHLACAKYARLKGAKQ
jgi:hypothetical protein